MKDITFCPLAETYIIFVKPELYTSSINITFNLSDHNYFNISSAGTNYCLNINDRCSDIRITFDAIDSPFVVVSKNQLFVPNYALSLAFYSVPLSNFHELRISSDFLFDLRNISLSSPTDKDISSFLSLPHSPDLSSILVPSSTDLYVLDILPSTSILGADHSDPLHYLDSPRSLEDLAKTSSNQLNDYVDVDDDDDLLQPQTLSLFLDQHIELKPAPISRPLSADHRPRLSILFYSFKSFFSHSNQLYKLVFKYPLLFIPYLRAISQYLHGRNRYPFLTFLLPLFTSIVSIFFLSISGTTPPLIYGAISYLVVGRMLKVSYAASKIARKIETDAFPLLLLSQIFPLFAFIFFLKLFSPLQFLLLVTLFYTYCQFFQYVLKFSHFIGDVRMFFRLAPSIAFAVFSFFGFNNPSFFLPVSFLSVILLMILFPRIFRLQSS